MATDVAPVLLEHWSCATFPFEIVPGMRELGRRITATVAADAVTCSTA
jgi:hypothetical protein